MPLRCYVIEDEPPAREILFRFIEARKDLSLAGWAGDARSALNYLKVNPADLVFLDVQLPGMSGFEMLEELRPSPAVIFTTAGQAHAVPAFDHGAVDFLLKPFSMERFDIAVNRVVQKRTTNPSSGGLAVTEGENHYLIPFGEIIYLSSRGKATAVHTTDRDFESQRILKDIESRLPESFLRIHKQYVLNLDFLAHLKYRVGGGYTATLRDSDETSVPVGRGFAAALRARWSG